jgi:hypothetical protein
VCLGLFGSSAIFKDKGDKLYKVGEKIKCKAGENSTEAEIVAIGSNYVTIMWEEKERKLKPFDVSNETKSKDKGKGKKPEKPTPTPVGGGVQVVQQDQVQSMPVGPRDGQRGGFGGFSGEEMRRMRDRYMSMSSEERDRFRAENRGRFMNRSGRGRPSRMGSSRRR